MIHDHGNMGVNNETGDPLEETYYDRLQDMEYTWGWGRAAERRQSLCWDQEEWRGCVALEQSQ